MEEHLLNNKIAEAGIKRLTTSAVTSQQKILDIVIRHLEKYPTQGGKLVWDKTNKKLLSRLTPELQKAIEDADFEKSMLRFFDDFDQIGQNIRDLHNRVNSIKIPISELQAEKAIIVDSTINGLVQANMNQSFLIPVKQALFNKIRFGASVTDTESYLRQMIMGDENAGLIERWVGQVARDSANQYEGTIHQKVKEEYGLTKTAYVGPILENTRPQCERWVEMGEIEDSELQNEIDWANNYGKGMIPGTDPSTFAILRGGYNCVHTAIPTK